MGSDWTECILEDCMEAIIDYRGKTPSKTDSGVPLITAKIIKGGSIQPITEFIAESDYDSWMRRGIPKAGDIVMTTEAPLGEVAQLDDKRVALAQRVITLRGKTGTLDNTFLKYLLSSHRIQNQLEGRASGTTVRGIKQSELRKVVLDFPPFEQQKAIAHILGSLDDKIELNRQMNATLEAMAQALFKSWFVDFDPVIDNALAAGHPIPEPLQPRANARAALGDARKPLPVEIQRQFPNRFVFNDEMGWVPGGGDVGPLSDIATLETLSINPNGQPETEWVHFSIPAYDDGQQPTKDMGESIKSGKYRVPPTAILASKLNPQFPRVWMPKIDDAELSICSTEFMPFVPVTAAERPFLYLLFRSELIQREIENRTTGSTGSRQRVKPREIAGLMLLTAPAELRAHFCVLIDSMFQRKSLNESQISDLSKTRDTLLPKLLSGQLRVHEAERQVAEVL
ncbi:MAG: restriction endonuclease subunit S [Abyssibacter sp.]|uniref:restriction endonuclease subunit S n=1 Tax=Abyssibacter sp. TaxID=2320200 RepID=UPI003219BBC6